MVLSTHIRVEPIKPPDEIASRKTANSMGFSESIGPRSGFTSIERYVGGRRTASGPTSPNGAHGAG